MQQTTLGRTGLRISRIILGGFPFGGINRARGWDPWSADGRATAIATINAALDAGINYVDTAPSYGEGNSERIIGEVMRTRRADCVLATKVNWEGRSKEDIIDSVHASLKRLQSEHIDVIQLHGGMYTAEDYHHIVNNGPLDGLRELRDRGEVRFIGLTAEEPWTARPFLSLPEFDVVQLAYNLIYQSAARHILDETAKLNTGVVTMRTMTSGIFQRMAQSLVPEWQEAKDIYEVCLKFVLSDSRVHAPIVGMRWPDEVKRNVALVESFRPEFDLAQLPRMTAGIYRAEDAG